MSEHAGSAPLPSPPDDTLIWIAAVMSVIGAKAVPGPMDAEPAAKPDAPRDAGSEPHPVLTDREKRKEMLKKFPRRVVRFDGNMNDAVGTYGSSDKKAKSHVVKATGDLNPAGSDEEVTPLDHVLGHYPKKGRSPYTSFSRGKGRDDYVKKTKDETVVDADHDKIVLRMREWMNDLLTPQMVAGTEKIPDKMVSTNAIARGARIADAEKDPKVHDIYIDDGKFANRVSVTSRRDKEVLAKGSVPGQFLETRDRKAVDGTAFSGQDDATVESELEPTPEALAAKYADAMMGQLKKELANGYANIKLGLIKKELANKYPDVPIERDGNKSIPRVPASFKKKNPDPDWTAIASEIVTIQKRVEERYGNPDALPRDFKEKFEKQTLDLMLHGLKKELEKKHPDLKIDDLRKELENRLETEAQSATATAPAMVSGEGV